MEDTGGHFLLKQRPSAGKAVEEELHWLSLNYYCSLTGLLAGLWEFPSVPLEGDVSSAEQLQLLLGQGREGEGEGEESWRQLLQAKHQARPVGEVIL